MVLAFDLGQRITHDVQEVGVGGDHIAVGLEFADRHGPVYCSELAVGFVLQHHAPGDVQCVLDHLDDFALSVGHRVVAGFKPDTLAVLVDALECPGDELAGLERCPQIRVLAAAKYFRFAEVAVRLAGQFIGPVAHRGKEVIVGPKDLAVETKLDHSH